MAVCWCEGASCLFTSKRGGLLLPLTVRAAQQKGHTRLSALQSTSQECCNPSHSAALARIRGILPRTKSFEPHLQDGEIKQHCSHCLFHASCDRQLSIACISAGQPAFAPQPALPSLAVAAQARLRPLGL